MSRRKGKIVKMTKKEKKRLFSLFASLILALLFWIGQKLNPVDSQAATDLSDSGSATITKITSVTEKVSGTAKESSGKERISVDFSRHVDGDTTRFLLDGETITVRYLCIDTQETVHPGKEATKMGKTASDYVKSRLENAKKIEIEYDGPKTDRYDRVLAWVWLDDVLFNKELVEQGLAEVRYVYEDYKYVDALYDAQDKAREELLGIWAA